MASCLKLAEENRASSSSDVVFSAPNELSPEGKARDIAKILLGRGVALWGSGRSPICKAVHNVILGSEIRRFFDCLHGLKLSHLKFNSNPNVDDKNEDPINVDSLIDELKFNSNLVTSCLKNHQGLNCDFSDLEVVSDQVYFLKCLVRLVDPVIDIDGDCYYQKFDFNKASTVWRKTFFSWVGNKKYVNKDLLKYVGECNCYPLWPMLRGLNYLHDGLLGSMARWPDLDLNLVSDLSQSALSEVRGIFSDFIKKKDNVDLFGGPRGEQPLSDENALSHYNSKPGLKKDPDFYLAGLVVSPSVFDAVYGWLNPFNSQELNDDFISAVATFVESDPSRLLHVTGKFDLSAHPERLPLYIKTLEAVLSKQGMALKYLHPILDPSLNKKNIDDYLKLVGCALKNNGMALRHVSPAIPVFRGDALNDVYLELLHTAVQSNGLCLEIINEKLNPYVRTRYVPIYLILAKKSISQNPKALLLIKLKDEWFEKKELCNQILNILVCAFQYKFYEPEEIRFLGNIVRKLFQKKEWFGLEKYHELAMNAVSVDGKYQIIFEKYYLDEINSVFLSRRQRQNVSTKYRELLSAAVLSNPFSMETFSGEPIVSGPKAIECEFYRSILLLAVQKNGCAMRYINKMFGFKEANQHLVFYFELAKTAVCQNGSVFLIIQEYFSDMAKKFGSGFLSGQLIDRIYLGEMYFNVVQLAVKNAPNLINEELYLLDEIFSSSYVSLSRFAHRSDNLFFANRMKIDRGNLFCSATLKGRLIRLLVASDIRHLKIVPDFKTKTDVLLDCLQENPGMRIDEYLRMSLVSLKSNGLLLKEINRVFDQSRFLYDLGDYLKLVQVAVCQNGLALQFFSEFMQKTYPEIKISPSLYFKVAMLALENNLNAVQYLCPTLGDGVVADGFFACMRLALERQPHLLSIVSAKINLDANPELYSQYADIAKLAIGLDCSCYDFVIFPRISYGVDYINAFFDLTELAFRLGAAEEHFAKFGAIVRVLISRHAEREQRGESWMEQYLQIAKVVIEHQPERIDALLSFEHCCNHRQQYLDVCIVAVALNAEFLNKVPQELHNAILDPIVKANPRFTKNLSPAQRFKLSIYQYNQTKMQAIPLAPERQPLLADPH